MSAIALSGVFAMVQWRSSQQRIQLGVGLLNSQIFLLFMLLSSPCLRSGGLHVDQ